MLCDNCHQPVKITRKLDGSWGAFLALLPIWLLLIGFLYLLLPGDADLWLKRGSLIAVLGLLFLIIGIPALLVRIRLIHQYECSDCGHTAAEATHSSEKIYNP